MTRRLSLLAVVLGALVAAAPAYVAEKPKKPLEVTSISPAVAKRGELVTVTGHGFGGPNVKITVAGQAVAAIDATGNQASFRVPSLAPFGQAEVRVTNPGGHSGEVGLTILFDGVSTPVLDQPRRVSATIGRAGGTLGSGGLTLTIPAGALSEDTTIALTPLLDLADSPLEGTIIGAAKLEPEGLRFLRPAVLSFPLPAGTPAGDVLGFGSAGDGSGLHLQRHSLDGGTFSLELWHFSTAGGSSGGAGAAVAMQRPISNAERQAMQRIAAAWRPCNAEQAQGIFDGPACANVRPESIRALFDWYVNAVRPNLEAAPNALSFSAEAALTEWLAWQAEVQLVFKNDPPPICGTLQSECDAAHALATTAVAAHVSRRLDNCTGTSLASQFRDVARMADFAGAGALDLTAAPHNLPDPTSGALLRACAHLRIDIIDFPPIPARSHANTLRGRVVTDVHVGADRTDVPFTLTVDGSLVTTAPDGSFQTTITPTSAPLDVTLEAEAVSPSLQNNAFTDVEHVVRQQIRDRLEIQALSSTSVPAGGSITVRVRVAGDGMGGMTVVLGGPGTTSAGPLVTNGQGEATAVFTVLSNAAQTSNFITAVLPDGTSAGIAITITINVSVSLSPATATVSAGGFQDFTATVVNSALGVTWNATGGEIVGTGSLTARYGAGTTPGTYSVTATSISDPSKSATATITILPAATVEGLYIGELCIKGFFQDDFSCIQNMQVSYGCSLESKVQSGRVCGWFASGGALAVPNMATFCQIETDGTSSGGPFTGAVTWCRFGPLTARQASAVINGSIGNGQLTFTLVTSDPDGSTLTERFIGTKF
jgi:hypothetical protein